ncbi:hypothetical protein JDV02_004164 [Purpureocillium takamizusanense]|uniref:Sulfatase N-terminal domain-containing protein n=1 Tax=Purpureocillium takamizusanense TaxID=2060973 RepID=A0A9Q8QDX2_9HYPO|nr:uncharacterized protein JDV02_004164 [Purpureocillium takamizusanense]UNI17850.1 hypothetical protein JDV02_004164 [Purpureocillium takamizusanense]
MSPPLLSCLAFSVFFVSVVSTKILHVSLNAGDFPLAVFLLCLPAFFLTDVVLLTAVFLLLRRKIGLLSLVGRVVACLISLITFGAASSFWSFWWKTGGEIEWADVKSFASDAEGKKVLLSESCTALAFASVLLAVSWLAKGYVYALAAAFVSGAEAHITSGLRWITRTTGVGKHLLRAPAEPLLPKQEHEFDSDSDDEEPTSMLEPDDGTPRKCRAAHIAPWIVGAAALAVFLSLATVLDPDRPYSRMLSTLPLPLVGIFMGKSVHCVDSSWPLPALIAKSRWELPRGDFKGWAPGTDSALAKKYTERVPSWMPDPVPDGFFRWDHKFRAQTEASSQAKLANASSAAAADKCPDKSGDDAKWYNPVNDPLRVSNLDEEVLPALASALAAVNIKHIALFQMESSREELFPIQQDSGIHSIIMGSHEAKKHDEINALLSQLTPNAEKISGKPGNFKSADGKAYPPVAPAVWNDTTQPGFGGITVIGGHTPSSASTKSMAASHCGVWPMSVTMFEESQTNSYQPCIPQILNLFNQLKGNRTGANSTDFLEQQWNSAFFMSITDSYDRQHEFEMKIGFDPIIEKEAMDKDAAKDPTLEEINYFGYPETALRSHMRDYITNATADNKRMFMSHFTSTTHHAWGVPEWFKTFDYMPDKSKHKDFNKYLNAVRFDDMWMGMVMQLFDDLGIANETLAIFVGDHGQAFKEDFHKTGTYANGHVSNFRVPIIFRHPLLPRVHYEHNATSVSIIPTILDLLINTGSLNKQDTAAASDLVHDYEGQSLIRPYRTIQHGRRAWNFGIVNPGGRFLALTSADVPWRLVIPQGDEQSELVFTDLKDDPLELHRIKAWAVAGLQRKVRATYGEEAATWVAEAEAVAQWWAESRKRLWHYDE